MPTIETTLGPVPIRGEITHRPKVLAITGVAASLDEMSRLPQAAGPEWDALVADLPGNRAPYLKENSLAAWARAFDEVVDQLGPTLVIGMSVGGLVGLSMRAPRHVIALDPPLVTGKLWPMLPMLQATARDDAHDAIWIDEIFGVYPDRVEGRDYRSVLSFLACPAEVICGDEPLFPQRPITRYPSFVDEPERALIRQYAPLHIAPNCGHAVQTAGGSVLLKVQRAAQQRIQGFTA